MPAAAQTASIVLLSQCCRLHHYVYVTMGDSMADIKGFPLH